MRTSTPEICALFMRNVIAGDELNSMSDRLETLKGLADAAGPAKGRGFGAALRPSRIGSVDAVRGLVIVLMALDHVRDFFGDLGSQPTNLASTSVALFFTRWVTHLCAPAFFVLAGVSASLARQHLSRGELARYLLTRGIWLILLELVVMRFALQFNFDYRVTVITVLWALGWSMITLAGLLWLPTWAIACFGAIMVAGHNTLDGLAPNQLSVLQPIWPFLHAPGVVLNDGKSIVVIAYVLIPWVAVTALGYALGGIYRWSSTRRREFLIWLACAISIAFFVLRIFNVYGDPFVWSVRQDWLWTLMSFLNTNKYPPSLLFLLMTLGPILSC